MRRPSHGTFEGLEHDISREAISDDHVGPFSEGNVVSFDETSKFDTRCGQVLGHQLLCCHAKDIAFACFTTDAE
jgi:hypothetical protein